jgi:L-asparaginase II
MYADDAPAAPVLARVVRSGFTEGVHRGSLVMLDADGSVALALGDVTSPMYPRSSNKPLQATAALAAGADLEGELLALAAASHSGEQYHVSGVREILARAGLVAGSLQCPPAAPEDPEARAEWRRKGAERDRLLMNCSGKHAAMLLACVRAGWPTENYLDPGHPLQLAARAELADAAGEPVAHTGVDGCGAPVMAVSLAGLARAFRSLTTAEPTTARRRVADAMRAHPEYVAGTRRSDTWLMRGVPGVLAKIGAEGVQAVAFPDGRALAFKLDDGAGRARGPVLAAALRELGVNAPVLDRLADEPLYGGGARVGMIEARF